MEVIDIQKLDELGFKFEITFGNCDGEDIMKIIVNRTDIVEIASVLER